MPNHRLVGDNHHDDHNAQEGNIMTLSREPAVLWIGLIAPVVACVSAFLFAASPDVQGAVNIAAVAVAGAVTAFLVRSDNLLPAITGAVQALVVAVAAFGVGWTADQQATLVVVLGAVAAVVVRDRVTAPVPAAVVSQPAAG